MTQDDKKATVGDAPPTTPAKTAATPQTPKAENPFDAMFHKIGGTITDHLTAVDHRVPPDQRKAFGVAVKATVANSLLAILGIQPKEPLKLILKLPEKLHTEAATITQAIITRFVCDQLRFLNRP